MRRADPAALAKLHNDQDKKLFILLEQACLESVKGAGGKEYQLLCPNKHKDSILKSGRDLATVRPDIVHQCLLMLLDSPLSRVGKLQVYIRTTKNVIIEVNPKIRIPRTFDRFSGLMVQLLHKLSIHAADGNHEKLLRVVKNPVTRYFPTGALRVGTSVSAPEVIRPIDLAKEVDVTVMVVGAMAHGSVSTSTDFLDKSVSISHFPLSAAQTCSRLCTAFEDVWDVEGEVVGQEQAGE